MSEKKIQSSCECCAYYYYDDEQDCYCCEVNLDEDEMCRFLSCKQDACPYFMYFDEYDLARKQ